ncbi:hypothetical protein BC939DRAFT_450288 [Gamsiella multidivaricata]|uniref:uncharacterized protein n=1 Tax=Gamsiella multidivaricata TaxID=101098 RepID=UPI002220F9EE|nr:uncharacterized protein BC939DRAFT_450288 [Gamsiella multidivaricata]KAI7824413.1 hypothetical protein BC939DRAFT_450288 [Gamsiella multidivaricata]
MTSMLEQPLKRFLYYSTSSFSGQTSSSFSSRPLKVKTESDAGNSSSGSIRSGRSHVSASIPTYSGSSANQSFHANNSQGSVYSHHGSSSSSHLDVSNGSKYGSHYTSLYANPTSSSSAHTISAASRRLTVGGGGDMSGSGSGSFYGGSPSSSRKNTTSMYVTGSNTIGVSSGAEYLRQANASSNTRSNRA